MGPWRFGPDSGARDRVDLIYHSDALYSAVCSAMSQLGLADAWFEATATASNPAVRFSSFFPFAGDTMFIVPPRSLWPPPESTKVRYKGAHFVPLPVIQTLLSDQAIDEDRWAVDGESECLIPSGSHGRGPFRVALRSSAGVDRLHPAGVEVHSTACLEFARDAGLWTIVQFADDAVAQWEAPVRSALLLLADSGFGGERSRGWGRSETPEWQPWTPPQAPALEQPIERAQWLLSLYTPSENDSVDWKRGSYITVSRRGRIESGARWGEPKQPTTMVAEGSVLLAANELQGSASNIAPAGFPHPVYRSGFAVTVPIPWRVAA
jgi:CRISPR type III-A-associated RAMP protein Csm4